MMILAYGYPYGITLVFKYVTDFLQYFKIIVNIKSEMRIYYVCYELKLGYKWKKKYPKPLRKEVMLN